MSHHKTTVGILFFSVSLLLGGCRTATESTSSTGSSSPAKSSSSSGTACANAYYPASPTLQKTYKASYTGGKLPNATYTESYTNFTKDGFVQKMQFAPMEAKSGKTDITSIEHGFRCGAEGLMALEYANVNAGQENMFKFKTVKTDGISFPNESDWKVGKKWQANFEVEGLPSEGKQIPMILKDGKFTLEYEIVAAEKLTVASGSYDTFKVVMTVTSKMNLGMQGKAMPMSLPPFKNFVWFAKDVGMVKSEVSGMATTELIELKK